MILPLRIAAIDTALSSEVSKKESPEVLKALALERIDMYKCTVNIYTDASRDTDNKRRPPSTFRAYRYSTKLGSAII